MKLLRITAEGLLLFKEKLDLSFYAQQRVAEEHKNILYPLFSNIYLNSANGFIGINISGKTSVLKVILLVLEMINNESIRYSKRNDIKKSDAYQSGFLEGTTPTYEAYMQLKKSIATALH